MIARQITVFDTRSIHEGDVLFIKIEDEYKRALVETAEEKYLKLVYINDAGIAIKIMIFISEYLRDNSLLKLAHCYMR